MGYAGTFQHGYSIVLEPKETLLLPSFWTATRISTQTLVFCPYHIVKLMAFQSPASYGLLVMFKVSNDLPYLLQNPPNSYKRFLPTYSSISNQANPSPRSFVSSSSCVLIRALSAIKLRIKQLCTILKTGSSFWSRGLNRLLPVVCAIYTFGAYLLEVPAGSSLAAFC